MRLVGFGKRVLVKANPVAGGQFGGDGVVVEFNFVITGFGYFIRMGKAERYPPRGFEAMPGLSCKAPCVGMIRKSPRSEWPVPLKCV